MEKNNCSESDDAIDRISNLPDVLLQHILSFLRTKEAVGTCVLSKRWKNTWACVPVFDISLGEFKGYTYEEREAQFEQFVEGVLQNRIPSNSRALEGCILQALKFKPRVLSLSVCKQELYSFDTDPIFTCESLHNVVLKQNLRKRYVEIAPSLVHLPCLKKLHITRVIMNDDFMNKISFGCPILEELFLQDCILNIYKISSGKLKKLILLDCALEQYLTISTPFLLELEVRGCCREIFSLSWVNMVPIGTFSWENLPSLINASIEFPFMSYTEGLGDLGLKLLTSLSNITCLDLQLRDSRLLEMLEKEVPTCPIFNNLKSLKLGGCCLHENFDLVAFFLHSPNLKRLTLHYLHVDPMLWALFPERSSHEEPKDVTIQLEYIEMVKIIKYVPGNFPNELPDELIDWLVKRVHAHVKIIGEIIIE